MYKVKKLVLIAEAEKTIQGNIGVSNVYRFLRADFEGVEFYAARWCVNLIGREEKKTYL